MQKFQIFIIFKYTFFLATQCPPGLVHYECFHHSCEPTCDSINTSDEPCPALKEAVCFPGCFCPNGLVREGDKCKEPSQCKNCVCKKQGSISYSSFDGRPFKLHPERMYVMSRVPNQDGAYDLEVLAKTKDCSSNTRKKICISEIKAIFAGHTLMVQLVTGENYVSKKYTL